MTIRRIWGCIVGISPHKDDEWLGFAQMLKNHNQTKICVSVTSSLWPDEDDYGVRDLETAIAMNSVNCEIDGLGVKEEDLFDPPYDASNYIGDTLESTWAPILQDKLQGIADRFGRTNFFIPSSQDAAGHVVHQFTRNIATTAIAGLTDVDTVTHNYSIYAEPATARVSQTDYAWKFQGFIDYYPSQWEVIKEDSWARNQVDLHCRYEYFEVE